MTLNKEKKEEKKLRLELIELCDKRLVYLQKLRDKRPWWGSTFVPSSDYIFQTKLDEYIALINTK